jgi:hypothetical protein
MSFINNPVNAGDQAKPAVQITALAARFLTGGETQGLVAGPDGSFHALWLDGSIGVMQLRWSRLTASGTVSSSAGAGVVARTSPQAFNSTAAMRIEVDQAQLDFATHTLSARVRIVNTSKVPLGPSVDLTLDRLSGALADLRVNDADNGKPAVGARWRLSAAGGASSLKPGDRTEARTLHLSFSGGPPSATGAVPALLEFSIKQAQP